MKKMLVMLLAMLSCAMTIQAQINRSSKSRLPQNSGLKIEIRIPKSDNIVVRETSDPADMFFFKLFELTDGPTVPGNLAGSCQLTEITGFTVTADPITQVYLNGDKRYKFTIPYLNKSKKYGVQVFPVNNRVSATNGYTLSKSGEASPGYCYYSVVDGKAIEITFGASFGPK